MLSDRPGRADQRRRHAQASVIPAKLARSEDTVRSIVTTTATASRAASTWRDAAIRRAPVRVDLPLRHERVQVSSPSARARHLVEMRSFAPSGRPLAAALRLARSQIEVL